MVATTNQLTAIATLVELDGAARRIVLYPPDLSLEYLSYVVQAAAVDAIISDRPTTGLETPGVASLTPSSWTMSPPIRLRTESVKRSGCCSHRGQRDGARGNAWSLGG